MDAHIKLIPATRLDELSELDIEKRNPLQAGVMAVFYPGTDSHTRLVLILRKTYQGVHSNQIGFPGGRVELSDRDLEHTALRETEEEVGIPQSEIQVIKELTKLYIPPSNFWVHPFMGMLETTPKLVPQESEVERILEVNLEHFLDNKCFVNQTLSTRYAKNIEVPAFRLNDQIVWGATAMMLSEIKVLLEKVL
ncbi:MAG TPA: CoA pyrophosphatase [Salegentibacter sp.]|nr:CoA pyrophosphatase [Salegentibacter sp.]